MNFVNKFKEAVESNLTQEKIVDGTLKFSRAIAILVICLVIIKIGEKIIHSFFERQKRSKFGLNEKKAATLQELFKSLLRYSMYFVAAIWIFDIKTVIAVTGVAGVAIGFGAQNLVKDIISGVFILFEDQFAVGDYVVIDGLSGFVEAIGIRVTKLRDFSGDLHIIPNGTISKVTNKSRGNMRALVDVDIAYEEDIDHAIFVIKEVCDDVKKDIQDIVEGPDVLGVVKLGESGITIRIVAKTIPMKQWAVEMELRRRIKYRLDKEGIEIPYPRRVILNKEGGK
ncbi:mechanosensitive ion channel family protein [Thermobrachium celere]|uniref:Potassium efflux system KefA protein / Small-conductance mechanosensitive channel n=1 Tax=Thermobrachium celere DSM 8682 TaxID=941824 RepID=R7RUE9_9CLOT|nr:mechanosensitive ion channel family protein [Thermobrachium celere]CDF58985.1 Potassium efflux system KefA protein / Small-conductance mechanosensitive channel [Thermobrachium celere DSM 8682]